MLKITKMFFKKHFPKRPADSYKNLNGRVLIVAGSADMPGAAILCARACYKAGAGLVTLAAPSPVYDAAVNALPEAIILRLQAVKYLDAKAVKAIASFNKKMPHDILLLGPGLGKNAKITLKLLKQTGLPAVIDADALNFLAEAGPAELDKNIPYILTPHIGEMRRLTGKKEINAQSAAGLSALTNAAVLLKGPGTIVCRKKEMMQNTTGNAGLAKAGSGDTLAGIIAGIWAQLAKRSKNGAQDTAFNAAALGVYLHGAAADEAVKKTTEHSLLASDVCEAIPQTIKGLIS